MLEPDPSFIEKTGVHVHVARSLVDVTRSIERMIPVELFILDGPKKRDEAGSVVWY